MKTKNRKITVFTILLTGLLLIAAIVIALHLTSGTGTARAGAESGKETMEPDVSPVAPELEAQNPVLNPKPVAGTDGPSAAETEKFSVGVSFISEDQLAEYKNAHFLSLTDSEYASHILITVNKAITDFRVWEIELTIDNDGNYTGREVSCIGTAETVPSEHPVILTAELEGLIPMQGISFIDPEGNVQHYYLAMSGENNIPVLGLYEVDPE